MGSDGPGLTFEEVVEWVSDLGGHPVKVGLWSREDRGVSIEIVGRLMGAQILHEEHPVTRHDYFFQVGDDGSWFGVSSLTFESARFGIFNADDPDGLWIEHRDGSEVTIVPKDPADREPGVIRAES